MTCSHCQDQEGGKVRFDEINRQDAEIERITDERDELLLAARLLEARLVDAGTELARVRADGDPARRDRLIETGKAMRRELILADIAAQTAAQENRDLRDELARVRAERDRYLAEYRQLERTTRARRGSGSPDRNGRSRYARGRGRSVRPCAAWDAAVADARKEEP